MNLCILIPAYNEEQHLLTTIRNIYTTLAAAEIKHNILVINDHSTDNSEAVMQQLLFSIPTLNYINNRYKRGFGNAIRFGLDNWQGDVVAIMMADASEEPADVVSYYRELRQKNVDCLFGSRFIAGSIVNNYPPFKLFCNRIFNFLLRLFTNRKLNDFTNAFKAYKRVVIDNCKPYTSENFSLTIEIPLKALKKGYTYSIIPISWTNRKFGYSKYSIFQNMPSYFKVLKLYLTNKM